MERSKVPHTKKPSSKKTYNDWEQLCKEVKKDYSGWIFRAAKKRDQTLLSSFDRVYPTSNCKESRWKYEAVMLREFKRAVHHYQNNIPVDDDYLEWFALARHYGMPSRMLDFTYSFYVAAYLALAEAAEEDNALIWAINLDWLRDSVKPLYEKLNIPEKERDLHCRTTFHRLFFETPPTFVIPVRPTRLNDRIIMQQGLFLGACNINETFETNLISVANNNKHTLKSKIHKLLLSTKHLRKNAIKNLRGMNISSASLFPGLSGFTESLRDYFYLYPDIYKPEEIEIKRAIELKNDQ
jgi:hypothetical protein